MATIKAYTDLSQSKKLAEILPIESADMHWTKDFDGSWFVDLAEYTSVKIHKYVDKVEEHLLPCWSLAALLGVLPEKYYPVKDHDTDLILSKPKDKWCAIYWDETGMQHGEQTLADNPVDSCYELISYTNLKCRDYGIINSLYYRSYFRTYFWLFNL